MFKKLRQLSPFPLLLILLISGDVSVSFSQEHNLFVSSRNTHSVKLYNGDSGDYIDDFVSARSGNLDRPQDLLWLQGDLFVAGRGNSAILRYDGETGDFIGNFTSGYNLDEPTKMALGPDSLIYVSQWGQTRNKVVRFRADTGAFVDEFTSVGFAPSNACGHAWDNAGNLYVATFATANIWKFDITGVFQGIFTEAGRLRGAVNLWFGADDDLFVVDWTLGSVLRFDGETGAFESTFIAGMRNTEGVTVGPDGRFYLCDWTQNQINRYDENGTFIDIFAHGGGVTAPNALIFVPTAPTAIRFDGEEVPRSFGLGQNYPNPFNPTTTITYRLADASEISLTVYDLLGREIVRLVEGEQDAGEFAVHWDGSDADGMSVSSGLYFYRLRAGDLVDTRKMILTQ